MSVRVKSAGTRRSFANAPTRMRIGIPRRVTSAIAPKTSGQLWRIGSSVIGRLP